MSDVFLILICHYNIHYTDAALYIFKPKIVEKLLLYITSGKEVTLLDSLYFSLNLF